MNNDKYHILKKNNKNKDTKYTQFFSGMKELKTKKFYKEDKQEKEQYSLLFTLRYAIILFVLGLVLILSFSPLIYNRYMEKKYSKLLYKELLFSYVDDFERSYDSYNDLNDNFISDYFYTENGEDLNIFDSLQ